MYPKQLDFRMPAEWEAHQRTLVSWPVQDSMVYPEDYDQVCRGYAEIIKAITDFEPVVVVVNPGEESLPRYYINEYCKYDVDYLSLPHNDSWLRDNGPTFVIDPAGNLAGINWVFNAWGGKYRPWDLDDALAGKILSHFGVRCFDAPLVMEGGSIHVDGEGTLLTTEECLLNPNRNPQLSREEIEACLTQYLGIQQVIWLKRGLAGDETDGHVDNVACFTAPGKILLQVCEDPSRENYNITQENLAILKQAKDARGHSLEIVTIPEPPPLAYRGNSLTMSYLNFYIVNGGIILPIFGAAATGTDVVAMQTLGRVFPGRKIRPVNGMPIIREGGNIHCITQQMPVGRADLFK